MTGVACDLDGVLWREDAPIPGVTQALTRLADAGVDVVYVTNNATRTAEEVADKVRRVCRVPCRAEDVITSTMAAMTMVAAPDTPVFVVGEAGLTATLEGSGIAVTRHHETARTVMVGMTRDFDYRMLTEAADAIRGGARFIATNSDPTYPVEQGLLPGAGSLVAAIAVASGVDPEVAGKPHRPMRDLIRSRLDDPIVVVGDRLDSDIAMATSEPAWTSILVLSGVTPASSDTSEADHVVADLSAAVALILA